ncbi:ectoine/hydroxyectoine ABC transporter substrate-binding protein EhuB [Bradyrhizobium sp. CCBAU 53421]|uniref:ectoine/hydroxyectoine ABC transporter substrate-binding protein EhuB n=1 Tax=Bradyrhizobium sp. CCBAU 53421 TaxID=1325120 RepID=UPI00188A2127|nr:ectoine/hydroxyectoine ABC transporter substrate-binding protein EhuB [Bradyrhizobium sp. CCBAU 53421]QOZ38381.1 ectoine/hydroxyectoine ABC transporter substrate-binding protein EhuB [Bradyrhizobium sp. CCBAU 53421]
MRVQGILSGAAFVGAIALVIFGGTALKAGAETLKEKVASEGKLTIGVHNKFPWGIKTDDGDVSGLYPDVLKATAESLGVKKVDFVVMDFGALIPSLLSRRIDVVASGMVITPARCAQVSFSNPFHTGGDSILVKKGNPLNLHSYEDIAKRPSTRVGELRGASTAPNAIAAGVAKEQIQLFPDNDAVLGALLADRIDAALFATGSTVGILRDPNVTGIERATPFTGLVINGREKKDYGAFEFRPEDNEFRDLFNQKLAQRQADGTVKTILTKYSLGGEDITAQSITAKELCGTNYH